MADGKPIFYDEERRRWRRTRRVLEVTGALFAFVVVLFVISVLRKPNLPELLLPDTRPLLRGIRMPRLLRAAVQRHGRKKRVAALGLVPDHYDPLRAAFYVSWDPASLASLQQHYRELDLLIPEELQCTSPDGRLDVAADAKLTDWLHSTGIELPMMSLLQNSDGTNFLPEPLAAMLANPAPRAHLIDALYQYALARHDAGIALDFELVPDSAQNNFRTFVQELSKKLHSSNLKLMVALPAADWAYDYKGIAQASDAVIVMNYDQHWLTSPPGPIAAQDWFMENLKQLLEVVPAQKIVVGIANYAYDWTETTSKKQPQHAEEFSVQEALLHAYESEAEMEFDPASLNPHYSYSDEQNHTHQVWLLDGVTAYNELRASERLGVQGTALWRMGSSDTSMWPIWDATRPTDDLRAKLTDLPPGPDLILEGDGDIWHIADVPKQGRRSFSYDASTDLITS